MEEFEAIAALTKTLSEKGATELTLRELQPLMVKIAQSGEVNRLLAKIIEHHIIPAEQKLSIWYRLFDGGLVFAENGRHALVFRSAARVLAYETYGIYYPSDRRSFINCSNEAVTFSAYRPPVAAKGDAFEPGCLLTKLPDVTVEPGNCILLDDDDIAVDTKNSRSTANLSLYDTRTSSALRWLFDRTSLMSTFPTIGDLRLSHVRSLLDIFGRIAGEADYDVDNIDFLKGLAEHPFHIIRWAAIQGISGIDYEAAIPLIIKSVTDKHSDIRATASEIVRRESLTCG